MESRSPAVVLGGARTPIGRYGGALSRIRIHDLLAFAMRVAIESVPPSMQWRRSPPVP